MTVNYEETKENEGILHFDVPKDDAQKALRNAYKRIKKDVNIPGFRKGKVNYQVFVRMFGESSLYEDALQAVLPGAFSQAIESSDIDQSRLVGQPQFDVEEIKPNRDWKLTATIALRPNVTLGEYENLAVPKQDRDVTDEEVENRIKNAQASLAEWTLKDAPAENGDTVVIDFNGTKDGEAFEGGEAKNFSLELGSGTFIPGFEEQLVGASEGDHKQVNVTFPEDYGAEDLAGADAVFDVTVHEVREKEVPDLDDEFAKDVDDEVETLDELREKYRKQLAEQKEVTANDNVEDAAIRQAVENATFENIPQAMIDDEVERQVAHYLNELQRQGISEQQFYQLSGTTRDDLRAEFAKESDLRVKTDLLLEKVQEERQLEVSDEELANEYNDLAQSYSMDIDEVKKVVNDAMVKHDVTLKKAMDLIVDSAVESDEVQAEGEAESESAEDEA